MLRRKSFLIMVFVLSAAQFGAGTARAEWMRSYGGDGDQDWGCGAAVYATQDGGSIVSGRIETSTVSNVRSWIGKLDSNGLVEWDKWLGDGHFAANDIRPTADGGYIVAGQYYDVGPYGYVSVIKLDGAGNRQWDFIYGLMTSDNSAEAVRQTADGGYVVAGTCQPGGGSLAGNELLVMKLDPGGTLQWARSYGGGDKEYSLGVTLERAFDIELTADGGYIVAGETDSFGLSNRSDAWLLKLDGDGAVEWEMAYGGSTSHETAIGVEPAGDGGYVVCGRTSSFASVMGPDFWVLKVDGNGAVVWEQTYGTTDEDYLQDVVATEDGGYAVMGYTYGLGILSTWLLKLDADGEIAWEKNYPGRLYALAQTPDRGFLMTGQTFEQSSAFCVLKTAADGEADVCGIITDAAITASHGVSAVPSAAVVENITPVAGSTGVNGISLSTQSELLCGTDPTLVTLESFSASQRGRKVVVTWSTAAEIDNAGFNVYRSEAEDGAYEKINVALIPAKGSSTAGAQYTFVDKKVKKKRTYYYKLEDVDLNGVSTLHGPVAAAPRPRNGIGR
ncbi:MAG: hypothetical protein GY868_13500 [Deltaproteobacteria bacterium]|nr:hypothetical protein [Deltaproteobacteria bacterium]